MGLLRVFTIASFICVVAVVFDLLPINLPHPACHHKVHNVALKEQPSPLEGIYKPNTALQSAQKVLDGEIHASESVSISPSGSSLFLADKFGWIHKGKLQMTDTGVQIDLNTNASEIKVPGRPLGIHVLSDDTLLVCDSVSGLLRVNTSSKSYSVLTNQVKGSKGKKKISFTNGLDVSQDGKTVYFTESTDIPVDKGPGGFYSILRNYNLNLMEGRATGRLLAYNFGKKQTTELLKGLWYANGVALSPDDGFVAVVETNGLRVHRYWLKGPKKGTRDFLISNLPGMPDGISRSPDGNFWIAVVVPVSPIWRIMPNKILRGALAWISEYFTIPFKHWGYVLKVSPKGEVLTVLSDVEGGFIRDISCVVEHNGYLFLGNVIGDYISIFDLNILKQSSKEEPNQEEPKEEL